ncbi:unnamed protein product [Ectocarpus sp. CCAP 1310/34]|nr:unnamed protein product [Ectocarpus sp. CCAP 1310/34]
MMRQRRRSKLEEGRLAGASVWSVRRYVLLTAVAVISLALPAALTFRPSATRRGGGKRKANVDHDAWLGIAPGIAAKPASADDIHVVFSTDCSPYQNYQAIMLFHSAEMVGQKGRVTRVASGCTRDERLELEVYMMRQPERFHVHFTPDYSFDPETGERFMFYNKPNGMAHYLKSADYPVHEAVVALVDPDMIFMSPLTPFVGDADKMLWHDGDAGEGPDWVEEGSPVGQFYGLGGVWTTWDDLREITENLGEDTPARAVSTEEALAGYPVGPPYMMHPRDWARVLDLWVALSPKVHKGHPGILAEMYGFCIAAAHIGLRHRVAYGLMVSDAGMPGKEGWPLVDQLGTSACDPDSVDHWRGSLPPIVHYCQMYRVGTFMWGKRHHTHQTFFGCHSDSLELPPPDYLAGPMAEVRVHPHRARAQSGNQAEPERVPAAMGMRQGYAMCAVLRAMNEALVKFKYRYCEPGDVSGGVRRFTDLAREQLDADAYS